MKASARVLTLTAWSVPDGMDPPRDRPSARRWCSSCSTPHLPPLTWCCFISSACWPCRSIWPQFRLLTTACSCVFSSWQRKGTVRRRGGVMGRVHAAGPHSQLGSNSQLWSAEVFNHLDLLPASLQRHRHWPACSPQGISGWVRAHSTSWVPTTLRSSEFGGDGDTRACRVSERQRQRAAPMLSALGRGRHGACLED